MKYISQVRFAQITGLALITVWRRCKRGTIKTKIIEFENKNGEIVMTPLIPETELHRLGY